MVTVDTGGDRSVPAGPSTSPAGKKAPSPNAFALKKQQSSAAVTPDRGLTPKRDDQSARIAEPLNPNLPTRALWDTVTICSNPLTLKHASLNGQSAN